jgi:hypothetical protein
MNRSVVPTSLCSPFSAWQVVITLAGKFGPLPGGGFGPIDGLTTEVVEAGGEELLSRKCALSSRVLLHALGGFWTTSLCLAQ